MTLPRELDAAARGLSRDLVELLADHALDLVRNIIGIQALTISGANRALRRLSVALYSASEPGLPDAALTQHGEYGR